MTRGIPLVFIAGIPCLLRVNRPVRNKRRRTSENIIERLGQAWERLGKALGKALGRCRRFFFLYSSVSGLRGRTNHIAQH